LKVIQLIAKKQKKQKKQNNFFISNPTIFDEVKPIQTDKNINKQYVPHHKTPWYLFLQPRNFPKP
jgi:hypothetical protein